MAAAGAVRRVRPVGAQTTALFVRGYRSSPTLAALVDALQRSDLIVHLQEREDRMNAGQTQLAGVAGGVRYVRIYLDVSIDADAAIALLAHELRHAWEIAQARWVVDADTLVQLYEAIGHTHVFDGVIRADTREARQVAEQVKLELQRSGVRF